MFLAIDIGNTNIVYAAHTGRAWKRAIRVPTDRAYGAHALAAQVRWVLRQWGSGPETLASVGVASVVPMLDVHLRQALKATVHCPVTWLTHRTYPWPIRYARPAEVGADRLAGAAGAHAVRAQAWIVLDFGTATTLDYVDRDGGYHGGPIAPGVQLTQQALTQAAAKLPTIRFAPARRMLPRSTVEAMQSGIFWGTVGGVEKTIEKMWHEIGRNVPLIATGGLAAAIVPHLQFPVKMAPHLTLDGIRVCARGK